MNNVPGHHDDAVHGQQRLERPLGGVQGEEARRHGEEAVFGGVPPAVLAPRAVVGVE
jgi:hypothetical protein